MQLFPPELPYPDSQSYKLAIGDVTQRSPMSSGYIRTRRTSVNSPTKLECSWSLTNAQARLLRDFYQRVIRQGADAFLCPVWVDGVFHTQQLLFDEPPVFDYTGPFSWDASGKLTVMNDLGPSLWREITLTDANTPLGIYDMTEAFRISRVDVFVRVAPNGPLATNTLTVGWTGMENALVNALDVSTVGQTTIIPGHAAAGGQLGQLQGAESLVTQWSEDIPGNACDIIVILPYSET